MSGEIAHPGKASFDRRWLELREPVDARSRATGLLPPLREEWSARGWSRILDLGSGTGSNLRYLAPRLPGEQAWTLLDRDAALLEGVEPPEPAPRLRRVRGDLAREGMSAAENAHLVTGSALLDLVSRTWLQRIVERCRARWCGAYFALIYDGRFGWGDDGNEGGDDPLDRPVRETVNAHQRRDKGTGPALGPEAGSTARRLFRKAGYRTWLRPSPWRLDARDRELARALLDGWVEAAIEQRPGRTEWIRAWARRRRRTLARDDFRLHVGHVDLLALPPARPVSSA